MKTIENDMQRPETPLPQHYDKDQLIDFCIINKVKHIQRGAELTHKAHGHLNSLL
jgi:hypothetical protein